MAKPDTITADNVSDLFTLNDTSELVWKISPARNVKVGAIAGVIHARDGYRYVTYKRRPYVAHRIIWLMRTGKWPVEFIDHIDGDRLNNSAKNLREATRSINAQNMRTVHSNNKSCGLLGVSAKRGAYEASLRVGKKSVYLGRHKTPELAHSAYLAAKRELHAGCTI